MDRAYPGSHFTTMDSRYVCVLQGAEGRQQMTVEDSRTRKGKVLSLEASRWHHASVTENKGESLEQQQLTEDSDIPLTMSRGKLYTVVGSLVCSRRQFEVGFVGVSSWAGEVCKR